MSRDKQIEEMANILLETSRQNSNNRSNNTAYTAFDAETIFKYGCDRLNGATALYNAGYRKAEETVRKMQEMLRDEFIRYDDYDEICIKTVQDCITYIAKELTRGEAER